MNIKQLTDKLRQLKLSFSVDKQTVKIQLASKFTLNINAEQYITIDDNQSFYQHLINKLDHYNQTKLDYALYNLAVNNNLDYNFDSHLICECDVDALDNINSVLLTINKFEDLIKDFNKSNSSINLL